MLGPTTRPPRIQIYDVDTGPSPYLQPLIVQPVDITFMFQLGSCHWLSFRFARCQIRFQIKLRVVGIRDDCENDRVSQSATYFRSAQEILTEGDRRRSFAPRKGDLTRAIIFRHRLLRPFRLCFRYQARPVSIFLVHFVMGDYGGLMVDAVAYASEEGSVTEDLRITYERSDSKEERVGEAYYAHVYTGGSHP